MDSLLNDYNQDGEPDESSAQVFMQYALARNPNGSQLIPLPDTATALKLEPRNVLKASSPAEAQQLVPLYGPLREGQDQAGGIYRQFRNHAMGHLLPTDRESAKQVALKHFELTAGADAITDRKRHQAHMALEQKLSEQRGIHLPAMSNKRAKNDDASCEAFLGPWAPFEGELERREALRLLSQEVGASAEGDTDVKKATESLTPLKPTAPPEKAAFTLHVPESADYQGRSWIEAPRVRKAIDEGGFKLPKKVAHTFSGHTKGINRIKWIPDGGHLILSACMDGTCKIWDVMPGNRKCVGTYAAHTKAVRDIQFTTDGRQFYSAGFDTHIKLWDTEYGKEISVFGNGKLPFSVAIHPDPSQQNVVVCASQNKRAVQYDSKSGDIVQEYSEHLAAVNTATFCEEGKKIVTTSDDKKMFIWEFGIGVVVKHIAEPSMHAMPAVALHPHGKFLACQSMDNQIVIYEGTGRFRMQSRKRFRGHLSTGYAILPSFSPDGSFLLSGDSGGRCWFWDWKTTKVHRSLQAHDGVCMSAIWNPYDASMVATAGWDGLIKLWE